MKKLHLSCYKIMPQIPLNKIVSFFNMDSALSWRQYIVLRQKHLNMILKYKMTDKQVYVFQFGCITFVNFNENEIRTFLEYLESIVGKIDYRMYIKYHDQHNVNIGDDDKFKLWESGTQYFDYTDQGIDMIAVILAKSVALSKIEVDITTVLDEAEKFIDYLKKGKLRANTREFTKINSKVLRFKYDSIRNIRIFDRPSYTGVNLQARGVYNLLVEYYELHDRFNIVRSKIGDLRNITKAYSTLSYKQYENRQFIFEIFLLALFPLMHIIYMFLEANHINNVYEWFVK